MTIKEFARLCACNAQTLRYYDRIQLLKPAKVDPWSGYRHYDAAQAIDFIKIKNLQAADFSIQEIKVLLPQSDQQIYEAFDRKIAEQEQKLERIREIQQSYLVEKSTMEQIIYSMTDYLLSQCNHPEVLTEFGLPPEMAPEILLLLRNYLNSNFQIKTPREEVTLTINSEVIRGYDAVLNRIHSLTKDNIKDTILLDAGPGHQTEENADSDPDFTGWHCILERKGWIHASEFIDNIPPLESGLEYTLWIKTPAAADFDDLSFPLFFLGTILYKQQWNEAVVNCDVSVAEREENQFKLLSRQAKD